LAILPSHLLAIQLAMHITSVRGRRLKYVAIVIVYLESQLIYQYFIVTVVITIDGGLFPSTGTRLRTNVRHANFVSRLGVVDAVSLRAMDF